MKTKNFPKQVAILGLGYVGLPLATALGRHLPTIGFDIDTRRITELRAGLDSNDGTRVSTEPSPHLEWSLDPKSLERADFFVVAVPTPVDKSKRPELSYLRDASKLIGTAIASSNKKTSLAEIPIVVYESTVYPGCTEEICIPILEEHSGLKAGVGFHVGYSPERINPGDTEHTLDKVVKVVAAQDQETLDHIGAVYGLVVTAGIHKAASIQTAEAAKVIENIQRDLNISLMNELAMLFHRMDIDLGEVLAAAKTKWNFLSFEPGLVGGHCVPEDPYYLTHKAQELGYNPEVILAGRRINESINKYVAQETVKLLGRSRSDIPLARILVLGASFKENVRDVRNSQVVGLVSELESYQCQVEVHDPLVDDVALERLGFSVAKNPFESNNTYDAVVLAVPHDALVQKGIDAITKLIAGLDRQAVLVDVRGVLDWASNDQIHYWSLLSGEQKSTASAGDRVSMESRPKDTAS